MSSEQIVDIQKTFGALLMGALAASLLGGTVVVQTLVYYRVYPTDTLDIKALVFSIWLLDTCHTGLIWGSIWEYLIGFYGLEEKIDFIPTTLALSILFTAILTFLVHSFFARRIFRLSKHNWYLASVIMILAFLRLVSATATTSTMLHYRSFVEFREHVRWLFTLGLALSSAVDVIVTGSLFLLLQNSRSEAGSLDVVIDSLILYTFETGSITCAATIVSMICWIAIPTQLVFMALHFIIGKFYATSLLVTLNARRSLLHAKERSNSKRRNPALLLDTRKSKGSDAGPRSKDDDRLDGNPTTELQISVQRSVQYTTEFYTDLNNGFGTRTL